LVRKAAALPALEKRVPRKLITPRKRGGGKISHGESRARKPTMKKKRDAGRMEKKLRSKGENSTREKVSARINVNSEKGRESKRLTLCTVLKAKLSAVEKGGGGGPFLGKGMGNAGGKSIDRGQVSRS